MTRITEKQLDLLNHIAMWERACEPDGYWYFFTQQGFTVEDAQALSDRGLIEVSEIEGKAVARLRTAMQRASVYQREIDWALVGLNALQLGLGKELPQITRAQEIIRKLAASNDVLNERLGRGAAVADSPSPRIGEEQIADEIDNGIRAQGVEVIRDGEGLIIYSYSPRINLHVIAKRILSLLSKSGEG